MNSVIHQKIINARKILILDYPFWGHLSLKLILKEDPTCKTGWTDGVTLGYNPFWIETLSNKGTIAWCAHEVCHPMCQHHTRRGGRNKSLWNRACDYVVNSILTKANFDLPQPNLHDPRFNGMSTDEVFSILEKEREEIRKTFSELQKKKGKGGEDGGDKEKSEKDERDDLPDSPTDFGSEPVDAELDDNEIENDRDPKPDGDSDEENQEDSRDNLDKNTISPYDKLDPDFFDDDEDPGNCGEVRDYPGKDNNLPSPSDMKQQEQDWKIATVQAATQAKQYGDLPAGLDAEIQNIVEPKVDPRDLLQRFVAQSAKNDFTWTLPNRRYIPQGLYLPSMKSEELGTVVLVLDTSISIGQKELDNFSAIVSAILEAYIIDATVLYCDTQVYEPEYFKREDLPLKLKLKGRGGTDFIPPFLFVKEHDIDPVCLIYLTDLECDSYPDFIPDYPVMWICTEPESSTWYDKPPFGEVIYINLEE